MNTQRWRRILIFAAIAAIVATVSFGRTTWVHLRFAAVQESQWWVLHTMNVLSGLEDVRVQLEVNHTRFDNIVSQGKDREFYREYLASKRLVYDRAALVEAITKDNIPQQERVRVLKRRIDSLFAHRDAMIDRVSRSGVTPTQAKYLLLRQDEHVRVEKVLLPMAQEEERLLRIRQARLEASTESFKTWSIVNGALALLLTLTLLGLVTWGFGTASSDAKRALAATLEVVGKALEYRDDQTGGHVERVHTMAMRLARKMGVSEKDLESFSIGVRLHDVGKIGVPDQILLKPGRLDPEERAIVERHVEIGVELVKPILGFVKSSGVVAGHHEKWDGSGYPRGLAGDAIPWGGRTFAVIDVYDALRSRRPYKEPMSHEEALRFIEAQAGKHFDPEVARAFAENVEEITAGIEWA
jgi:HD-GYP domain-containing protein (c-di-GMP phosphodiesterase class II)